MVQWARMIPSALDLCSTRKGWLEDARSVARSDDRSGRGHGEADCRGMARREGVDHGEGLGEHSWKGGDFGGDGPVITVEEITFSVGVTGCSSCVA